MTDIQGINEPNDYTAGHYTPTTDVVRKYFSDEPLYWIERAKDEWIPSVTGEAFDRWFAEEIRKAKHEAWHGGFTAGWQECDDPEAFVNSVWDAKTPNPYREGEQE